MSAKDIFHEIVKEALKRDGWTITHDPYPLVWGTQNMAVDLAAEAVIAAEFAESKIAVEIKSFINPSVITDLYLAVGQYTIYFRAIERIEPQRTLYLAIPITAYEQIFNTKQIGDLLLEEPSVFLLVFDPANREVVKWIPEPPINPLLSE